VGHVHGRLIAFDLDGTLVDSSRDLADSVNELLAELGASMLPRESITKMIGEGARVLIHRALAASGRPDTPDALARFLAIYDTRLLAHTLPYDGVAEVVRHARRHARTAVLTNKPFKPTEKILDGLGLRDLFDDVIGSDGPFPRKPDPAALRALMERAAATPARTLMVGDSKIDYETATNASARSCIVSYGFNDDPLKGIDQARDVWVVRDPADLEAVIDRFVSDD